MKQTASSRRQQIVSEATRLFSEQGFEKVTTKALAASCEISEPALYRYFPSKDAIYDAVLDTLELRLHSEALFQQLKQENDIEKLLYELATEIFNFFSTNQDVYRLMLYSTLAGHEKARQIFQGIRGRFVAFLIEQLERLHAADLIIEKNYEITARCFTGMVFECALTATLWRGFLTRKYKPAEVIANNTSIFARGLRKDCPEVEKSQLSPESEL